MSIPINKAETQCRENFSNALYTHGPFWHFCTPGDYQQLIFSSDDEYEVAMNLIPLCAIEFSGARIVTFEIMSNHVHFILWGDRNECLEFFNRFKRLLHLYISRCKSEITLDSFKADPFPIPDLEALRAQILYTNRNNYVVDPMNTPFSYPYGANSFYFNPYSTRLARCTFGDLVDKEKRKMFHTHKPQLPGEYEIIDNHISPLSYCWIKFGESVFRDARHYFHRITRDIENYRTIAGQIGDSIYYTDNELSSIVYDICRKKYAGQKASLLPSNQKIELAKTLHFEYNADNAKISRLLNLPIHALQELFPRRS